MRRFVLIAAPYLLFACTHVDATSPANTGKAQSVVDAAALAADTSALPVNNIIVAPLNLKAATGDMIGLPLIRQESDGYENQPAFIPGRPAFYYVSEGDSGKTDIWLLDIDEGMERQINATPDVSEYSPRLAPGGGVSFIQENASGEMTRVHQMTVTEPGNTSGQAAVVEFGPVGYYVFLDNGRKVAVYYRSDPGSLYLVDVATGDATMIAENIGRALAADPTGTVAYYTSTDAKSGHHALMAYDLRSGQINRIVNLTDATRDNADYALLFDSAGSLAGALIADQRVIYLIDAKKPAADWKIVADYSESTLGDISRIAISDDRKWIAFVAAVEAASEN